MAVMLFFLQIIIVLDHSTLKSLLDESNMKLSSFPLCVTINMFSLLLIEPLIYTAVTSC